MAIAERGNTIAALVLQMARYESVVGNNTFSADTLTELKNSCKRLVDDAKTELDEVKAEINNWS